MSDIGEQSARQKKERGRCRLMANFGERWAYRHWVP